MTMEQSDQAINLNPGQQTSHLDRLALVVDDNFAFRSLAVALLEKRGFDVREAVDANEALVRLQNESFDLVLLDIHMPGMKGDELCRFIRRYLGLKHLPVIAYTADGLGTCLEIAQEAGFDDVLLKPVNRAKLEQILADRFVM